MAAIAEPGSATATRGRRPAIPVCPGAIPALARPARALARAGPGRWRRGPGTGWGDQRGPAPRLRGEDATRAMPAADGRRRRRRRRPLGRIGQGAMRGGLGVCVIMASAALGAAATIATRSQPGLVLGLFVLAGTVAAALTVEPRAGRLIFPVPALSYLVAALVAGGMYNRSANNTELAVGAAQWIANGFFVMVLATLLAIALTTVRWFLWRRSGRVPLAADWPAEARTARPPQPGSAGARTARPPQPGPAGPRMGRSQIAGRAAAPGPAAARPRGNGPGGRMGPRGEWARREAGGGISVPVPVPAGSSGRRRVRAGPRRSSPGPPGLTTSPAGRSAAPGA